MATASVNWSPTPTSLTFVRPCADGESQDSPTRSHPVVPVQDLPEPEPDQITRFRPIRMFASGGQGVVYVAHDIQIGRDVALKELKPRSAERPLARSRFIREAEITGRLEHPGIVPVYALGKHPDGRPYYAMRLIQGTTLQDAVNHFFNPELKITPAERRLLFRKLLQRFVSVCQTVAYAHSQSIVHRDIKPSNILLGSYGEAMVADWGLARTFHPNDGCSSDPEISIEPGPGDSSVSDSTQMGSALGTPAFMSPEQANGQWDQVGPVSDVYSLGATLYVILTGQSPLPKLTWPNAYKRIIVGDFPPPRQINPQTPRALAAICVKAMKLDRADRYQSALALAEDIEHYLADEPVSAAPPPIAERVGRWVRHNRTLVAAAAGLWFTFFVALGIGLVVVQKERDQKENAVRYTLDALDRTTSQAVDQWLRQSRALSSEQKQFLGDLLVDYTRFTSETGSDPVTQLRVARAFRRVGEIHLRLGQHAEAEGALAQAESRGRHLTFDDKSWHEWARIRTAQGYLAKERDRLDEAEKCFGEALIVLENRAFADREADDPSAELAEGYNNHGASLKALGRDAEAVAAFRAALRLRNHLAAKNPESTTAQLALATASANLGGCLLALHQFEEAEKNLQMSIDTASRLVEKSPEAVPPREELAASAQKLGTLYYMWSRQTPGVPKSTAEASKWLDTAVAQYERLALMHPADAGYALSWTESINNRMAVGGATVDIALFDRVIPLLQRVEHEGASNRVVVAITRMRMWRAKALDRLGRHIEAANEWQLIPDRRPEEFGVNRTHRALQLIRGGQVVQSLDEIEVGLSDPRVAAMAIYNSACIYSLAAERGERERRSARAVELLIVAKDRGFFVEPKFVANLDNDADLAGLRTRDDYKVFRAGLPPAPPRSP
ncbi:MAG: serine/threonine-protein kinase [Gemmataceae bacterium]|nr:serine/threonine-protein kinase [Gemmataceae bacterium]